MHHTAETPLRTQWSLLCLFAVPTFNGRDWGIPSNASVRLASLWGKIWTPDFLNTKQEFCVADSRLASPEIPRLPQKMECSLLSIYILIHSEMCFFGRYIICAVGKASLNKEARLEYRAPSCCADRVKMLPSAYSWDSNTFLSAVFCAWLPALEDKVKDN